MQVLLCLPFIVLGHSPNICSSLYHINPGTPTKKNNTCAVFIEGLGEEEDVGVLHDEGEEGQRGRGL